MSERFVLLNKEKYFLNNRFILTPQLFKLNFTSNKLERNIS